MALLTKRDFAKLYKKYGASALAQVFGVPTPTVRRWKSAGLPKSREAVAQSLEVIRRHEGYEEKALREMMSEAQQAGKLPKVKSYSKFRNGEKTTGYEFSKPGKAFLNPASLLNLVDTLESESMAKGLPNWLASVTVSAFVEESEKAGSADVRYQVDHPDANNFVVESIVSSGLQGSRRDAIGELTRKLREKMSESEAKFYLHGVYFSTYRYKSERESLDLRSERRRKRK